MTSSSLERQLQMVVTLQLSREEKDGAGPILEFYAGRALHLLLPKTQVLHPDWKQLYRDVFIEDSNMFLVISHHLCAFLALLSLRAWDSLSFQFNHSIVSDSVIPWTAACHVSLSITNSQSLLKLMSFKSVMPSNHLCQPLLLLTSIFPVIQVFSNESILLIG